MAVVGIVCAQDAGPASAFGPGLSSRLAAADTVFTSSYYFSDLAFAGGYQTTLTLINYSPQAVICTTNFFADSGSALSIPFGAGVGVVTTRSDVLAPGGSIHDQTIASLTDGVTEGYAQAQCTGPVQASLLYRLYQSGTAVGEASVNAEPTAASKFVTFAQTATGIAFANPSANSVGHGHVHRVQRGKGRNWEPQIYNSGLWPIPLANIGPLGYLVISQARWQCTSTAPIVGLSLNAEAFPVFSSLPPGDVPAVPPTGPQSYYFSALGFRRRLSNHAQLHKLRLTICNLHDEVLWRFRRSAVDSFPAQGNVSTRVDVLPPGGSLHDQTTASLTAAVFGRMGDGVLHRTHPSQSSVSALPIGNRGQ